MGPRGEVALQDQLDLQGTRGLLETQVQRGPEETRARTGSLDLQERKEPWGLPGPDPEDQREGKEQQEPLEIQEGRAPVAPLVHVVPQDSREPPGRMDLQGLPGTLEERGSASRESRGTVDHQEDKDPKVLLVRLVLLVLPVRDAKETKGVKEQPVPQDPLVILVRLVLQADWAQTDPQDSLVPRATWGTSAPQDQ